MSANRSPPVAASSFHAFVAEKLNEFGAIVAGEHDRVSRDAMSTLRAWELEAAKLSGEIGELRGQLRRTQRAVSPPDSTAAIHPPPVGDVFKGHLSRPSSAGKSRQSSAASKHLGAATLQALSERASSPSPAGWSDAQAGKAGPSHDPSCAAIVSDTTGEQVSKAHRDGVDPKGGQSSCDTDSGATAVAATTSACDGTVGDSIPRSAASASCRAGLLDEMVRRKRALGHSRDGDSSQSLPAPGKHEPPMSSAELPGRRPDDEDHCADGESTSIGTTDNSDGLSPRSSTHSAACRRVMFSAQSMSKSTSRLEVPSHDRAEADSGARETLVSFGEESQPSNNEGRTSIVRQSSHVSFMDEGDGPFHLLEVWQNQLLTSSSMRPGMSMGLSAIVEDDKSEDGSDARLGGGSVDPGIVILPSGLWPSLTTPGQRLLQSMIISPSARWRVCWDLAASPLVFYECIMIPLLFLELKQEIVMTTISWIVRLFWTADMPISFLTGYLDREGRAELRPKKVVRHYVKTWFFLDILMLLGDWGEVFLGGFSSMNAARIGKIIRTLRIMRMMRLMRLFRIASLVVVVKSAAELVMRPELSDVIVSISKFLCFFLWVNHLMACGWAAIGHSRQSVSPGPPNQTRDEADNWLDGQGLSFEDKGRVYAVAYHWSLQQFSGSAEVWPWNVQERVFALFCGIMSFVISTWLVSGLTATITYFDIVSSQDTKRITELKNYLFDHDISSSVSFRILRNAEYAFKEQKRKICENRVELLQLVSEPLRKELHYEMHMPVLGAHPFFKLYAEASPSVMRQVCHTAVSRVQISAGDTLFSSGEVSLVPQVYFVLEGNLRYMHHTGQKEKVEQGHWASEGSLWTPWCHKGSMFAKADCILLILDAKKFQDIAVGFRNDTEFCQNYGQGFLRHLNSMDPDEATDLEDPEMDIEWVVMRACPQTAQVGGLAGKIMRAYKSSRLMGNSLRLDFGVGDLGSTPSRGSKHHLGLGVAAFGWGSAGSDQGREAQDFDSVSTG